MFLRCILLLQSQQRSTLDLIISNEYLLFFSLFIENRLYNY